jgi:hypothetical protein
LQSPQNTNFSHPHFSCPTPADADTSQRLTQSLNTQRTLKSAIAQQRQQNSSSKSVRIHENNDTGCTGGFAGVSEEAFSQQTGTVRESLSVHTYNSASVTHLHFPNSESRKANILRSKSLLDKQKSMNYGTNNSSNNKFLALHDKQYHV